MTMVKLASNLFFGRTGLRTRLSGAKFDAEADFDVRSAGEVSKGHGQYVRKAMGSTFERPWAACHDGPLMSFLISIMTPLL